jgi:signal transduction histidine kinase
MNKVTDEEISAFAGLLRQILGSGPDWPPAEDLRPIGRKGSRKGLPSAAPLSPSREALAKELGLSYDSFHGRLAGRTQFRAHEIRRLIRLVDDMRLVNHLLDGSNYVAAARIPPAEESSDQLQEGMFNLIHHLTSVIRAIEEALRDRRVSHDEQHRILYEVMEAESALAAVRALVDAPEV